MRCRSFTENYYMPAMLSPLDVRFSPTWRPSWGPATIALSARIIHPVELRAIFHGGKKDSHSQPSSDPSLALSPSSIPTLTQTLARKLALGSRSEADGEPGDSYQVGKMRGGTLVGQRQSVFGSSSLPLPPLHPGVPISSGSYHFYDKTQATACTTFW
jgi:hypothetical protein